MPFVAISDIILTSMCAKVFIQSSVYNTNYRKEKGGDNKGDRFRKVKCTYIKVWNKEINAEYISKYSSIEVKIGNRSILPPNKIE